MKGDQPSLSAIFLTLAIRGGNQGMTKPGASQALVVILAPGVTAITVVKPTAYVVQGVSQHMSGAASNTQGVFVA